MKEETELFEINIGASVTVGTYILSRVIKKIYGCGKKEIKYKIDNTKNIEKMILESEIDVGIVEGEINSKAIKTIPFMEDELVFVCESGRLEGCDTIGTEELEKERLPWGVAEPLIEEAEVCATGAILTGTLEPPNIVTGKQRQNENG